MIPAAPGRSWPLAAFGAVMPLGMVGKGGRPGSEGYEVAIGYGRHSIDLQNEHSADDQNAANKQWVRSQIGDDVPFRAFVDEAVPGSMRKRDGLSAALEQTHRYQRGVLVVESISRLGRHISLVLEIVDDLTDRGWRFVSRYEQLDTDSTMGRA